LKPTNSSKNSGFSSQQCAMWIKSGWCYPLVN
jgi:hypothetical protein